MVKIRTSWFYPIFFLGQSVTLIFITKSVCHILLQYGKENPISSKENKTLKGNLPPQKLQRLILGYNNNNNNKKMTG